MPTRPGPEGPHSTPLPMQGMTSTTSLSRSHLERARTRQQELTKPPGSLGLLEDVAVRLAGIQASDRPVSRPAAALLFASDHPVARHGVSAYPQSVTAAMVSNILSGGAASSVFADHLEIPLQVVDVGVLAATPEHPRLHRHPVADAAVGDLVHEDAMSPEVFRAALAAGREAVERMGDLRLLLLGEMGIGNTTPASAVTCALLGMSPAEVVGPGTGVEGPALRRKQEVVEQALGRLPGEASGELALRVLGGRELAAIAGAALCARERGIAVLADGFIVSAALLAATRMDPSLSDHLILGHRSAEPAHAALVAALGDRPLVDLGLRLGEATGALAALPLVDLACAMHRDMATFAEAQVEGPA